MSLPYRSVLIFLGDKFAAYAEEDELEDEVEGEEDGEEGVVEEEGGVDEDLDEDVGDKNVHKVGAIFQSCCPKKRHAFCVHPRLLFSPHGVDSAKSGLKDDGV